jgi:hypothetical protein
VEERESEREKEREKERERERHRQSREQNPIHPRSSLLASLSGSAVLKGPAPAAGGAVSATETAAFSPVAAAAAGFCCFRPFETLSEGAVLLAMEAWLAGT